VDRGMGGEETLGKTLTLEHPLFSLSSSDGASEDVRQNPYRLSERLRDLVLRI